MPRPLAQFLCLLFIIWLWRYYERNRPGLSRALWIPTIWLLVLGSRPLSFWFGVTTTGSQLEGNAFDRTIYLFAIFVSVVILSRRGFRWRPFVKRNWPIFLFYAYLLATMFWAEYPFVVFKRWFKDIGAIAVMMLILTDEEPLEAIEVVFLRCAYVLLPLSVLFVKYIPELGRFYTRGGGATYCGVTCQKNSLGELVLVFSLLILWRMLFFKDEYSRRWLSRENWLNWLVLGMGAWLLWMANSKSAALCLSGGLLILFSHKLPFVRSTPRTFLTTLIVVTLFLGILQANFQISDTFLRFIGRNQTLTNRTLIWEAVKEHPVNQVVGCGYLMYWEVFKTIKVEGDEVELKTAHNGYVETYLDGGWLGVGFLTLMLLALAGRTVRAFLSGTSQGRLQFAFFVVMLLYNISESMFARRSPLWFTFLLVCLERPTWAGALMRTSNDSASEQNLDSAVPAPTSAFGQPTTTERSHGVLGAKAVLPA